MKDIRVLVEINAKLEDLNLELEMIEQALKDENDPKERERLFKRVCDIMDEGTELYELSTKIVFDKLDKMLGGFLGKY